MPRFTQTSHPNPTSAEQIADHLQNPLFGKVMTDHMVSLDWSAEGGWVNPRVEPYGKLSLDPASAVLHYSAEIFEGMKAYLHADGGIYTFRPRENAARLNRSARRMALPELPEDLFLDSLKTLLERDYAWVPSGEGQSLYLRPYMIGTDAYLGVRPIEEALYQVIASPAGNFFGKTLKPVSIWVSRDYVRAAPGGTGAAKTGGNYAGAQVAQIQAVENGCQQVMFLDPLSDNSIEELGGMNVFFVTSDNRLLTPELTGTILEGVTRSALIQLAEDAGMSVEQRRVTLAEVAAGARDGAIIEAFACGTAAAVSPIGQLRDGDDVISFPGDFSRTLSLREELLGIQAGTREDRHGWLYQLR